MASAEKVNALKKQMQTLSREFSQTVKKMRMAGKNHKKLIRLYENKIRMLDKQMSLGQHKLDGLVPKCPTCGLKDFRG